MEDSDVEVHVPWADEQAPSTASVSLSAEHEEARSASISTPMTAHLVHKPCLVTPDFSTWTNDILTPKMLTPTLNPFLMMVPRAPQVPQEILEDEVKRIVHRLSPHAAGLDYDKDEQLRREIRHRYRRMMMRGEEEESVVMRLKGHLDEFSRKLMCSE